MSNNQDMLARAKLTQLLKEQVANQLYDTHTYPSVDSIGTLRTLLAPSDTLAFPQRTLDTPVRIDPTLLVRGLLGKYYNHSTGITIDPEVILHRLNRLRLLGAGSPYETLLHEAGHARDADSRGSGFSHLTDLSERYADALADSLTKARGIK